jgi:peptidoglycan/LPS O-acetylase OafA/YrhL
MNGLESRISYKRNPNIDFWRGITAFAVVCLHVRCTLWPDLHRQLSESGFLNEIPLTAALLLAMPSFGHLRVAFLFVISGFCIHGAHVQSLRERPAQGLDIKQFAWRRARRIYPPLFGALILTALVDSASGFYNPSMGKDDLYGFLVNLLTLQNFLAQPYGTNFALWAIAVEVHIYIMYPILHFVRRSIGLNKTLCLILIINLVSIWFTRDNENFLFTNFLPVWWFGAFVAERPFIFKRKIWLLVAIPFILLACLISYYVRDLAFQFAGLGFAMLFSVCLDEKLPSFIAAPFIFMGRFGYSIYLVHMPIAVFSTLWLKYNSFNSSFVAMWAVIALSLVTAYLFYLIFEQGSMKLTRRYFHATVPGREVVPAL